jgi:hypothetical protein
VCGKDVKEVAMALTNLISNRLATIVIGKGSSISRPCTKRWRIEKMERVAA